MSVKRLSQSNIDSFRLPEVPDDVWQRPSDWLALETLGNTDQKIVALMAIYNDDSNYVAFACQGAYTVDWGDGTSNNYASNIKASHKYTWDDISSSTLTSEGFRQAIITVTPQAGQTLSTVSFQHTHPSCNTSSNGFLYLEIKVAITGSFALGDYSTNYAFFPLLKILTIANHQTNLGTTLLRNNAHNVTQFFITKQLNILGSGPFQYADSLEYVYLHPSITVTDASNLFLNCRNLKYAPYLNTTGVTGFTSMFSGCTSLKYVPLYNTSSAVGVNAMFQECSSLKSVPKFSFPNVITFANTFNGCRSLKSIPDFGNTANNVDCTSMFMNCTSLKTVNKFQTGTIELSSNMFSNCYALKTVPFLNLKIGASAISMFSNCGALEYIPEIFQGKQVGGFTTLFSGANLLKKIPIMDTIPAIAGQIIHGTTVTEVQTFDARLLTSVATTTSPLLRRTGMYGGRFTVSYANKMLGRPAINEIIDNLGNAATSQTLTITGNPGANAHPAYTRAGTGITSGTDYFLTDTSNLVVGMQVTGTGISTGRTAEFAAATDIVTLTAHGFSNGKKVAFSSLTTVTGFNVFVIYYVINATTDTFKLSLTPGGAAIDPTVDGAGVIIYQTLVTNINPGVSVTVDTPFSASPTSAVFRNLNTQFAVMKRWVVTG